MNAFTKNTVIGMANNTIEKIKEARKYHEVNKVAI